MHTLLPSFSTIDINHLSDTLKEKTNAAMQQIKQLLNEEASIKTIEKLEDISEQLSCFWHPIEALNSCCSTLELSGEYEKCLLILTRFQNELLHNKELFKKIKSLETETIESKEIKKIIENHLRDFKLAGVDLNDEEQEKFSQQQERLSILSHQFEENLRLNRESFQLKIENLDELSGIPESTLALCRDKNNHVVLTLDLPIYISVMQYADNREIRKKMYHAYVTLASELSEKKYNNADVMTEILALRRSQASLVGFDSYCDYSLANKMAKKKQEVLDFLENLAKDFKPKGQNEFDTLQAFAKKLGCEHVEASDVAYYSEKLKLETVNIDSEKIRQYFPLGNVMSGLFKLVEKLFGFQLKAVTQFDRYTDDLKLFSLHDQDNNLIGYLYNDLFTRQGKRGGAWMAECYSHHQYSDGKLQHPVAFLNCNFNPPHNNKDPLLTHDDVLTLFHELGHCLHHLLTHVNHASIAGINNVPWDAVELPSQFLENWAWEWEIIQDISCHVDTQETMPKSMFDNLKASRRFQSGMRLLRQLEFAIFDFKLHCSDTIKSNGDVQTLLNSVREQVAVVNVPDYNRFQNGFSHIFAGGYAAGYYSYLWAEVLSADVYSLFTQQGILNTELNMHYKNTILANGGLYDINDLLKKFLDRDVNHTAFLKQYGIE